MRKNHVLLDFIMGTVPSKIAFARNVQALMTGNPNFPTPDVPLTAIKEITDLLESNYIDALNEGKTEIAVLHQTELIWDEMMRLEARYVDRIANGDAAIIIGAGFNVTKQPAPSQKPEFSAEAGEKPGSVLLHRQAVKGAKSYVWQYCMNVYPETEEQWVFAMATSKASVELTNLKSVTRYWFRVAAVTPEGTSAYNDPIMHIVV